MFSPPNEFKDRPCAATADRVDRPGGQQFDLLVDTAAKIANCPIALITILEKDWQRFKAKTGVDIDGTPRQQSFCAHAVTADAPLIVPDAQKDARFANNPLVTDDPSIRFYTGVPIRTSPDDDTAPVGALCVIDTQPRDDGPEVLKLLENLASIAEYLLGAEAAAQEAIAYAEQRHGVAVKLERLNRQFRQAEQIANIGSWSMDIATSDLFWSDQVYEIHGLPRDSTQHLTEGLNFYMPRSRKVLVKAIEEAIATGRPYSLELDFTSAKGDLRRVRASAEAEISEGKPSALIGVFQDITEQYRMQESLRQSAFTDELTMIASRRGFNQEIERAIDKDLDRSTGLALLMIDLDNFKIANDRLGHDAGDQTLRAIAEKLQAKWLTSAFPARLGGDEFVLLLRSQDLLSDLPATISRLLYELRHVPGGKSSIEVTGTIGACLFSSEMGRSDLLKRADEALYDAKAFRRNTGHIWGRSAPIWPVDETENR